MSEVKPVTTEPVEAVAPAPVTTTEPVVESTPETAPATEEAKPETKTEEPAATDAPVAETSAEAAPEAEAEPAKDPEPISEGVLETKVSFIPIYFKKYTYFFSEDAISADNLSEALKKEKTKVNYPTFAHATQTGKGLFFATKGDKTKPVNVFRLDGAVVTTQSDRKFTVKGPEYEVHLEAANKASRDQWVFSLKAQIADAEGVHAATKETEGYSTVLEKFSKPAVIVAAAAATKEVKEEVEEKKEEKEEEEDEEKAKKKAEKKAKKEAKKKEKEEKKAAAEAAGTTVEDDSSSDSSDDDDEPGTSAAAAAKVEKKEEKKEKRSSSKTRNRFSFFGGKKEKEERKEEEVPASVAEAKEEAAPVPVAAEPVAAEPAPATTEPTTATETTAEAPKDKEVEEPKSETSPAVSPKASNRKSFLGSLPSFLKGKEKEKKTETPATTAEETPKSADPVPEIAATTEVQPLAPAKETEAPAAEPVAAPATEETKPEPTKTEGESSKSPALGLVDNIKGLLIGKPKDEEKKKEDLPDAGASKDIEPAAVEATPTEAPKEETKEEPKEPKEGEATTAETPRDRKSSFFGSLRRDKSTDGTDDKPKRSLSFWKNKEKKPTKEEAPAAITETETATKEETTTETPVVAATEPIKTEPATKETAAPVAVPDTTGPATESEVVDGKIGDVVPAAVTVGGEPSKV